MKIISLVGMAGAGKDSVARILVDHYGYRSFSFAESLKDSLASIFCWRRTMLEGKTNESRIWRETVDEWWADKLDIPHFTPRWAMQNIGTDVFRKHFHQDIWTMNIERKLSLLPPHAKVVISDGRFENEIALSRSLGGVTIRVKRGPEPEWFDVASTIKNDDQAVASEALRRMNEEFKVHASEWSWIGEPIDHVIENDSTLDALVNSVVQTCFKKPPQDNFAKVFKESRGILGKDHLL